LALSAILVVEGTSVWPSGALAAGPPQQTTAPAANASSGCAPTSKDFSTLTPAQQAIQALTGPTSESPTTNFSPGETIFTDDFATLDPNWSYAGPSCTVHDGKFVIKSPVGFETLTENEKYSLPLADIAVSVAAAPETTGGAAGLMYRTNIAAYITFEVDPRGSWGIFNSDLGVEKPILLSGADPSVNTTPHATNRLEVIIGDKLIFFLINGQPVTSMATPANAAAYPNFGLVANGSDTSVGDYEFSNLVVKMPPKVITNLVAAAPTEAPGQTIFSDKFASLDPSWGYPNAYLSAANGQLRVTIPPNSTYDTTSDKYTYGPVDLSTDVTVLPSGDPDMGGGLTFWGADDRDFTLFDVQPQTGEFFATRVDNGKNTTLIDEKVADAIKVTPGATNHLEVSLRADKAYLIVNGREVGELPAPKSSAGGLVGFDIQSGGSAKGTVAFSNFLAQSPSSSGPPAGTLPALADGQASFTDDFQTFDAGWGQPSSAVYTANNRMEVHSDAGRETDRLDAAHLVETGDVSASMAAEDGTQPGASGGLLFWAKDYENYTLFSVDPRNSKFAAFQEVDGKSKTLLDWSSTMLLDAGANKPNRIEVALRSGRAILMINGHQVGEITQSGDLPGTALGFDSLAAQNSPGNFGFTHLVVTPPEAGDLPPGTAAAPAASAGQTIFSTDFNTLDPTWGVTNASIYVDKGRLQLRSAANGEVDAINNKYSYSDVEIDASTVKEAGDAHGPIGGLLFWAADPGHYTLFSIDPISGKYAAFDQVGNHTDTLLAWAASSAINKGVGAVNRLTVAIVGGRATLFVNGRQVGALDKPASVPGNLIGLYAGGSKLPGSYSFSDFAAKAPEGAEPAPSQSAAAVPAAGPPAAAAPAASGPASAAAAASAGGGAPPSTPEEFPESPGGLPLTPFNPGAPSAAAAASADIPPPPARAPGPNEQLVLSDDFSTFGPAWGKPTRQVFAQNNRFVTQIPAKGFAGDLNGAYRYYDADISFAGRVASGPPRSGVEAMFWMQDNQHYDYLYINAAGRFAVFNLSGTAVTAVVPDQTSAAIRTGVGQWNTVELALANNAATLIINGTEVAQFAGSPPIAGGVFGLVGNGAGPDPSTIEFANLRVTVPSPFRLARGWTDIETANPQPAPPGASLVDDFQSFDPNWSLPSGFLTVANNTLGEIAASGAAAGLVNEKYLFGEGDVDVTAELTETSQTDTFATLFFWGNNNLSDTYQLSISPLGYFRLEYHNGSQNSDVLKWQGAAAIRQGVGQANTFGVSLKGNGGAVIINGQAVAQFTASPPASGGLVGLGMLSSKAGPSTWDFSKFRVSEASAQ
jgi:hypothetical protein